jgi:predicted HAD superfamily Cof-like phosphohydrolase
MNTRDLAAGLSSFPDYEQPLQELVAEFHVAMGVPIADKPTVPPDDRVRLRCSLIAEECFEFLESCLSVELFADGEDFDECRCRVAAIIRRALVRVDLADAADALADIAYVVEGANLEFGIDSGPVLDEVHRANMAKVNGPVRADGKRLKPEGWTPPDIEGVLRKQGGAI